MSSETSCEQTRTAEAFSFGTVSLGLSYPPPGTGVEAHINRARTMCVSVSAQLTQRVTDGHSALNQLQAAGQTIPQASLDQLAEIQALVLDVQDGCMYFEGFFQEIFRIFLPCCAACIVIAFSLWVNQMLCCVTGCCKGPPAKAPEGKKGTEMQSVTVGDEFKDLSQP